MTPWLLYIKSIFLCSGTILVSLIQLPFWVPSLRKNYAIVFEKFAAEVFSFKNERNSFELLLLVFAGLEGNTFSACITILSFFGLLLRRQYNYVLMSQKRASDWLKISLSVFVRLLSFKTKN